MNAILIFDVSTRRDEVIQQLVNRGYFKSWLDGANNNVWLPHNSVWKKNIELNAAYEEFRSVIISLNGTGSPIIIQRCVVLSVNPWVAINGQQI